MQTLHVATACNDRYAFPASVMMHSLADNLGSGARVVFHVLTAGLNENVWNSMHSCAEWSGYQVRQLRVDPDQIGRVKIDRHITIETYFRLLLPSLIPDIDRVLYLDCDMVICRSVMPLYHESFDGQWLLAVAHANPRSSFFGSEGGVPSHALLGIPATAPTFNAGLMMIDLDVWRQQAVCDRIFQYLQEYHEYVLWWDQDGLNAILHDKWRALDPVWNVMASHVMKWSRWEDSVLDQEAYRRVTSEPAVIHYSSTPKPWMSEYAGPFLAEWESASAAVKAFFPQDGRCS